MLVLRSLWATLLPVIYIVAVVAFLLVAALAITAIFCFAIYHPVWFVGMIVGAAFIGAWINNYQDLKSER